MESMFDHAFCSLRTQKQSDDIFSHGQSFLRLYLKLSVISVRLGRFIGMSVNLYTIMTLGPHFSPKLESGFYPCQRLGCYGMLYVPFRWISSYMWKHTHMVFCFGHVYITYIPFILKPQVSPPAMPGEVNKCGGSNPRSMPLGFNVNSIFVFGRLVYMETPLV